MSFLASDYEFNRIKAIFVAQAKNKEQRTKSKDKRTKTLHHVNQCASCAPDNKKHLGMGVFHFSNR